MWRGMNIALIVLGGGLLLLAGCGGARLVGSVMHVADYQFVYQGASTLEKSLMMTLGGLDFLAIYTESGTGGNYQDSLLVTEKYNQGKGVIVFSQEAMATLRVQGLTLAHEKNERFVITCAGGQKSVNLISYTISSGVIAEVLPLYVTQMVMEKDSATLLLWSHTTEDARVQQQMISSFKTIRCKT
jgi:hypothetical protein